MHRRNRHTRLEERPELIDVDSDAALAVSADGERWTWPAQTDDGAGWDGAEFELDVGGTRLSFYSENPVGFLFDFLPALARTKRSRRVRLLRWRRRQRPPGRTGPASGSWSPETAVCHRLDTWMEIALGSAYAEIMQLIDPNGAAHDHQRDGGVSVCRDCRQVFIDLASMED